MFCVSRCLLHVCCVMSHKTISCECEGESLLHVIRSERWEMWLLWREGARWMTQDVDITHHRIPMLHCYTIFTYMLQADSCVRCPPLQAPLWWSHVTGITGCSLSNVSWLSIQVRLPPVSRVLCSRSALQVSGYLPSGQAATPGQGETLITARTMKLSAGRPGPGSRKTRRHSLTWCFDLIEA